MCPYKSDRGIKIFIQFYRISFLFLVFKKMLAIETK